MNDDKDKAAYLGSFFLISTLGSLILILLDRLIDPIDIYRHYDIYSSMKNGIHRVTKKNHYRKPLDHYYCSCYCNSCLLPLGPALCQFHYYGLYHINTHAPYSRAPRSQNA